MSIQIFAILCCLLLVSSMSLVAITIAATTSTCPSQLLSTTTTFNRCNGSPVTYLQATPYPAHTAHTATAAALDSNHLVLMEGSGCGSSASSSQIMVSATTLDPTTFLSDVLGGFINSNLILAVPIVAALSLASLVAFLIVSYANPASDEDDDE